MWISQKEVLLLLSQTPVVVIPGQFPASEDPGDVDVQVKKSQISALIFAVNASI